MFSFNYYSRSILCCYKLWTLLITSSMLITLPFCSLSFFSAKSYSSVLCVIPLLNALAIRLSIWSFFMMFLLYLRMLYLRHNVCSISVKFTFFYPSKVGSLSSCPVYLNLRKFSSLISRGMSESRVRASILLVYLSCAMSIISKSSYSSVMNPVASGS